MPRIVVIGAGLLGGSLLAALQAQRLAAERRYHLGAVSSAATLEGLRARGWCDALHEYDDLAAACAEADLVLLCTPLSAIEAQIDAIAALRAHLAANAIVMDVGSTKAAICKHGFAAFPDTGPGAARFVGGHPMAGSERSGLAASDPLLYQSALWVLCPPDDLPAARLTPIIELVKAIGARVAILDPQLHDAAVARISHVPQVLASVLAGWAGAEDALADASLALAAGGFRDMTRLALSSWDVWRDIVATNPQPIADGLRELAQRLALLADAAHDWSTDASDRTAPDHANAGTAAATRSAELFGAAFAAGKAFRDRFRMPRKGIVHDLSELVVRLDDRPGQLLALLTPLAAAGINVQDLEILKVREGESGTVLLGFSAAAEAEQACAVLEAQRFTVTYR
ncbi:MAG: prephenate dehydrogenase/arogenate dehydrogenase family protein [Gemmatimonadaceae bacterium]|nr:prephenate dehydrogenase/arogenate dehydrogenase family protein [Gemmatimonadaceae bacterium]